MLLLQQLIGKQLLEAVEVLILHLILLQLHLYPLLQHQRHPRPKIPGDRLTAVHPPLCHVEPALSPE